MTEIRGKRRSFALGSRKKGSSVFKGLVQNKRSAQVESSDPQDMRVTIEVRYSGDARDSTGQIPWTEVARKSFQERRRSELQKKVIQLPCTETPYE